MEGRGGGGGGMAPLTTPVVSRFRRRPPSHFIPREKLTLGPDNHNALTIPPTYSGSIRPTSYIVFLFRLQAAFYLLFLVLLSFALIYGSSREDPLKYSGSADELRLFCEIFSIIFVWFYAFEEINQIFR